jgi:hypothetical protein
MTLTETPILEPEAEELKPADLPPIRWTIYQAAKEFGIPRTTLRRQLQSGGVLPGADGCYETRALCNTIFGSLHQARLKQIGIESDISGLKLARLRAESLDAKELGHQIDLIFQGIKSIILGSDLPMRDRQDILASLSDLPMVLERQAKQQRQANGEREEASFDHPDDNIDPDDSAEPVRRRPGRPRKKAKA